VRLDCPEPATGPFRGWTLALVAGVYFLLPIGGCLTATTLVRSGTDAQAAAGIVGLVIGMTVAAVLARAWARHGSIEESTHG
jgi:hypothetical protein